MIIVFNPVAGMRRASLLWRVLDVLVANGIRLELAETHRPGHAEALAREAVCARRLDGGRRRRRRHDRRGRQRAAGLLGVGWA